MNGNFAAPRALISAAGGLPRRFRLLGGGVVLSGTMLLGIGCDIVSPEEAQQALASVRQVRVVQDSEIRPRLAELEQLQQDEIEPREQQLQRLGRQSRSIYRDRIEPLQEQLERLYPEAGGMMGLDGEFDPGMRAIMEQERQLESEMRQLGSRLQGQETVLDSDQEQSIRTKQDQMNRLTRQMDEAQRRGRSSIDALYREMEEVQGELSRIPPGVVDSTYLRQRLVELQGQIARRRLLTRPRSPPWKDRWRR